MGKENDSKIPDIVPILDDDGNDVTDYKSLALEQNRLAKENEGLYKRFQGKYHRLKNPKAEPGKQVIKSEEKPGLDYGQKAFLNANGIKGADAIKLAEDYLASGKYTLDSLIENKHFQNDLKDLMDDKAAKEAIPNNTRGSGSGSAKDSVDYWLNKGEMPPVDKPLLRQQYVNARYAKEKGGSPFVK